ncbi:MAG: helix-turn-helix domain-containing protein [Prevotella sp.]|nr:helix-turn-helix domain-containing protein [Prevotella sp.]
MTKFDEKKLAGLRNAKELLDAKYGEEGTDSRRLFDEKARAYYYGVILRDRRKELKMTQKELADKTGTARSYIARIERGDTDMQLSSFLRIAEALKISFTPVFA